MRRWSVAKRRSVVPRGTPVRVVATRAYLGGVLTCCSFGFAGAFFGGSGGLTWGSESGGGPSPAAAEAVALGSGGGVLMSGGGVLTLSGGVFTVSCAGSLMTGRCGSLSVWLSPPHPDPAAARAVAAR